MSIQQLPFTLNIMLEYIVNQEKRRNLVEDIQQEENFEKEENGFLNKIKSLFEASIE